LFFKRLGERLQVTFPELLNVESLLRDPLPALSANNNDYSDDKRQPAAAQDVQPDADSMSEVSESSIKTIHHERSRKVGSIPTPLVEIDE